MTITSERLRFLREQREMSQAEVAKYLGISRPAYVQYETCKTKPVRKIKELCTLFNVTSDYILGNDIDSNNKLKEKKPKDLIKLLEKEEYTLNGAIVTQDDKEKLKRIIEVAFWDAKNKRKK